MKVVIQILDGEDGFSIEQAGPREFAPQLRPTVVSPPRPEEAITWLADLVETLTPREIEMLRLIAGGVTYKEIGRELSISPNTIKSHGTRLVNKLGFHSMDAAISWGWLTGLITADDMKKIWKKTNPGILRQEAYD